MNIHLYIFGSLITTFYGNFIITGCENKMSTLLIPSHQSFILGTTLVVFVENTYIEIVSSHLSVDTRLA